MNYLIVDKLIKNALIEDINYGDVTTDNLLLGSEVSKGRFIAKEPGVIAGIDVAKRVFEIVDSSIIFNVKIKDSSKVEKGDVIVELEGNSKSILKGERVALNILQRMCGIATKTNRMVDLVKDYDVKIVDTRKTLPGFRILDKYSVTAGGGYNHRLNLSDFVMIKDNHIRAVGSITEAVKRIKNKIPFTAKVEVEVENLDQLKEAVNTEVDVIMLDNMDVDTMRKAVKFVNKKFILEASGNVTENTIGDIASTGVDIISIGSLTHSVKALDISLRFI
ncbi:MULTISPECIES: carboxylating nicotinate-nucleotide diphosphorylase [Clostridium]|uniref:nicotinate-nucleotide diphosphorylase (carboxylating) n=4 Tax=Clostridium TaxID=1485 RepID=A0ABM5NR48_9CLOT|nr:MULTISPECIES: carboxylating nicotinate-nucleotide diphosphorylase [Clostridium]ADK15499.1 nicotinate-nucleotide pyrophosphorylase [Clostridium ljungdahlii DSM 13528]AGY74730.1 carboxylating nicotinate-nucleotide diphosphorylase [Clostridium autoethanogenum DSM 10061]ALU34909.1 Nicotinate-nucleotide pyrophosphorylase [Clostridium autoethanogenum DSM 10061]OAA85501.1 putative nicotinate-nucleotide pyrophosphorylase [carboxylating] [Clostridium ljungdahlii DSM 13528]OAA93861.1 putative nicotin